VNEAEEFLEDFGEQALSAADLERLLERACATNDRDLRVLVKQYQALKHVTGELLERTESTLRGSQSQQDQILKLAHFLIHSGDPGAT
jgi:hypothetical protein